ncbi:MAG: carboxypeptidase regulatory-like domain-containing protein, partial [Terriglobales bacterium]
MPSILWIALLMYFAPPALALNTITGSVRNESRRQPAAGDEVILIRLDQGMQEEEHARTDARGAFWLKMRHDDKPYLVRVKHQNVNYDQRPSVGGVMT